MSAKNEENQLKVNTDRMIMGQLISISYQMMMFEISKEKTKSLIEKFIKFHLLNQEDNEQLMKCIENYTKEVRLVYNKNIDENSDEKRDESKEEEEIDVVIIKNK